MLLLPRCVASLSAIVRVLHTLQAAHSTVGSLTLSVMMGSTVARHSTGKVRRRRVNRPKVQEVHDGNDEH